MGAIPGIVCAHLVLIFNHPQYVITHAWIIRRQPVLVWSGQPCSKGFILQTGIPRHPTTNAKIVGEAAIMKAKDEIIKDFDDIFKYIGGWGPFQVKFSSYVSMPLLILLPSFHST